MPIPVRRRTARRYAVYPLGLEPRLQDDRNLPTEFSLGKLWMYIARSSRVRSVCVAARYVPLSSVVQVLYARAQVARPRHAHFSLPITHICSLPKTGGKFSDFSAIGDLAHCLCANLSLAKNWGHIFDFSLIGDLARYLYTNRSFGKNWRGFFDFSLIGDL